MNQAEIVPTVPNQQQISKLNDEDIARIRKLRVTSVPHVGSSVEESGFLSKLGTKNREVIQVSSPLQKIVSSFSGYEVIEDQVAKVWKSIGFGKKMRWRITVAEEYQKRFGGIHIGPRCFEKMLTELTCDLYNRGFLICEEQTRARIALPQNTTRDNKITSVGFVSGNRVDSLLRAVESFGKNCLDHGRPTRIVVCDDSRDPSIQKQYQDRLTELKNKYGFNIVYVGPEEKKAYCQHLVEKGFDADLLNFAIIRSDETQSAYGKNRNSLLLACVGERFFSADDDTNCVLHAAEDYKAGINFGPSKNSFQSIKAFPDRTEALTYSKPLDKCFLDLHEKVLGKTLAECTLDNPGEFLCTFGDGGASKFPLLKAKGRVSLSFNGLVGDSGSGETTGHLFVEKEKKKDVFRSEEYYALYSKQRNIYKSSSQINVARNSGCMTTFLGVDATQGMPPFFPYFRMEDAIFAKLNFLCEANAYQAFLPWQIEHLPLENRQRPKISNKVTVEFVSMHEMISAALENFSSLAKEGALLSNLERASKHVLEICALDGDDFNDLLMHRYLQGKTNELYNLQNLLATRITYPKYWKKEVKTHIEALQSRIGGKIIMTDSELMQGRKPEEAEQTSKEYLYKFAKLMGEWPAVLSASLELKQRGIVLGRTL